MKKYLLFLFLSIFSITLSAQNKELTKADNYYNQYNYNKALKAYQKLANDGISLFYTTNKIAECYSSMGDAQNAVIWYKKAVQFPDVDYKIYYHLALELKKLEQYDQAQMYMNKYYTLSGHTFPFGSNDYNKYVQLLSMDSSRFEIYPLKINSPASEFGPAIYANKLIFSSNRPKKGLVKRGDVRTNKPFFSLYESTRVTLTELNNPSIFAHQLNSDLNNGPICFNQNDRLMFITQNTEKSGSGKVRLTIVLSKKEKGKWQKETEEIPLTNLDYSIAHPSMTLDGKRFFFTSDMPGGQGGMDLYVSEIKNGVMSPPRNLGAQINTAGNELFPFLDRENKLYFTSDGHPGLGGYDIFIAIPLDAGYSPAFNMGYPLNTSADDFSLVIMDNQRTGYLASNRPGGKGEDDIYAFRIIDPLNYCQVKGTITNEVTRQPLAQVTVTIKNDTGIVVDQIQSNSDGFFHSFLKSDGQYQFEFRKRYYYPVTGQVKQEDLYNKEFIELDIGLQEK
ncbi:hypothetical protein DMA11_23470 [Marinilabiliaceae bacterium JC017]|nr:hypothetical protein DMA11_23470 [Marinilabiliaceae bacterium JC017]